MSLRKIAPALSLRSFALSTLLASGLPASAWAQAGEEPIAEAAAVSDELVEDSDDPVDRGGDIVVVGQRGSVDGEMEPETQLDEADVKTLGASTIAEVLTALAPETGSARGRGGGGGPVVLLNGRRISGFGELRNIPSEAIERVDILPEEAALRYGYSADQRVVNFVLKSDFEAITTEIELGAPTRGRRSHAEADGSFVAISPDQRFNISTEYSRDSAITEAERDILADPRATSAADPNFRTLVPQIDQISLEGTYNRPLTDVVSATLSAMIGLTDTQSLLGRSAVTNDGALERLAESGTGHIGGLVDGRLDSWRWVATANADIARTQTRTDRETPAGPSLDRSATRSSSYGISGTFNGPLVSLDAGEVAASVNLGLQRRGIESAFDIAGVARTSSLTRTDRNARASLDVPLGRNGEGPLSFVGRVSINANAAVLDLSDFGALVTYGYGANWSPKDWLQVVGSFTSEQGAPSLQQLGDPILVTPNAPIFDFSNGQTVFASTISGGNPSLIADERRVWNLGTDVTFTKPKGLGLSAQYTRVRSDNPIASFPVLSPEIEAAFPDRFIRNAAGELVSFDQRPINFASAQSDTLRWGLTWSSSQGRGGGGFGGPGRGGLGGGPGGSEPRARGGGPGYGNRPGGGTGAGLLGQRGENTKGNWRVSAFHTWALRDRITIADGVPVLDLLNGSATGGGGGQPEHSVSLNGGYTKQGIGGFGLLTYFSPTTVDGGVGPDGNMSSPLFFGSRFRLDLRTFVNFDDRPKLLANHPWLKGVRLRLAIDNLTDSVQEVSDASGFIPLRYQAGFVDPVGRTVEISIRKQF